jgi:hypothetical protein
MTIRRPSPTLLLAILFALTGLLAANPDATTAFMKNPTLAGQDIGSPALAGKFTFTPDRLEIEAGGEDIWGTRDEFHFASVPVTGDFALSVRLLSLSMADVYTKAGVMARASLEADAAHVMILAFGDNQARNKNNGGLEFQSRLATGGACTGIYPPQPLPAVPDFPVNFPQVWLKLSRTGDTFTSESSTDGVHWKTFSVHRHALPATVHLGLAVTSHNRERAVRAVFSELSLSTHP